MVMRKIRKKRSTNNLDKRYQKTHNIILGSLSNLSIRKPLHSIRVVDICREADISGATFYRHYRDIDDFVKQESLSILQKCMEALRPTIEKYNIKTPAIRDGRIRKFIYKHSRILKKRANPLWHEQVDKIYKNSSIEIINIVLESAKQGPNLSSTNRVEMRDLKKNLIVIIGKIIRILAKNNEYVKIELTNKDHSLLMKILDCTTPVLVWYIISVKNVKNVSTEKILLLNFKIVAEIKCWYALDVYYNKEFYDLEKAEKIMRIIDNCIDEWNYAV